MILENEAVWSGTRRAKGRRGIAVPGTGRFGTSATLPSVGPIGVPRERFTRRWAGNLQGRNVNSAIENV